MCFSSGTRDVLNVGDNQQLWKPYQYSTNNFWCVASGTRRFMKKASCVAPAGPPTASCLPLVGQGVTLTRRQPCVCELSHTSPLALVHGYAGNQAKSKA